MSGKGNSIWLRRSWRAALWISGVLLGLLFLLQVALLIGISWLNSTSGEKWVEGHVNAALAKSSYSLSFDGFRYRPLSGIGVKGLQLADDQGVIASLADASLHVGVFPLAAKHLSISLSAETLNLSRLPEAKDEIDEGDQGLQPFILPDFYFHSVSLSDISLERLQLGASVAGQAITLRPRLSGRLQLQETGVTGKLVLEIENAALEDEAMSAKIAPLLPLRLEFGGGFDAQALLVTADRLNLLFSGFSAKGKAQMALSGEKNLSGTFAVLAPKLSAFTPETEGALEADLNLSGTADHLDVSGKGSVSLDLLKAQNVAPVAFDFHLPDLPQDIAGRFSLSSTYDDKPILLSSDFALKDGAPALHNLQGSAAGAVFSGGRATHSPEEISLALATLSYDMLTLSNVALSVRPEDSGPTALSLSAKGRADKPFSFSATCALADAKIEDLKAELRAGKSRLSLSGTLAPDALNLTAQSKGFFLRDAPVFLPDPLPALLLSLDVHLSGSPGLPVFTAQSTIKPVNGENISVQVQSAFKDGQADLTFTGRGTGIKDLSGKATMPLRFALQPFAFDLSADTQVQGSFQGNLEGSAFSKALLGPGEQFSGTIRTSGSFDGALGLPQIKADLNAKDASFSAQNGAMRGVLDADLSVRNSSAGTYLLSGTIDAQRIDVTLPERFTQSIPSLNVIEPGAGHSSAAPANALASILLDMSFNAPQRVFVRGWGLDAELGGAVKIEGAADDPQFDGKFSIVRGRYSEFGKRFTISKADMLFAGSVPPSPTLSIVAETKADDVTAQINISGSPETPKFAFSSVPALPEDEVLARILFGQDMSKISPMQAVQLTQTLQRFSGNGGGATSFDPLGMLRSETGLDDLRVETGEDGAASVGAGKYLSDNVYLDLQGGREENSGAATIEIEVTPNITIESEIGQDAQGGAGVFWEWDY